MNTLTASKCAPIFQSLIGLIVSAITPYRLAIRSLFQSLIGLIVSCLCRGLEACKICISIPHRSYCFDRYASGHQVEHRLFQSLIGLIVSSSFMRGMSTLLNISIPHRSYCFANLGSEGVSKRGVFQSLIGLIVSMFVRNAIHALSYFNPSQVLLFLPGIWCEGYVIAISIPHRSYCFAFTTSAMAADGTSDFNPSQVLLFRPAPALPDPGLHHFNPSQVLLFRPLRSWSS